MGQAWCKDKSTKAQDSKSPLDQVFVRCAHRIYPGLKEEGSVLGGATQRVTSSEIGYAGSPPRAVLLRGRSIDSVDRPFHPSEWVDVNLEVPCTPRASVILSGERRPGDLAKPSGQRMHPGRPSPGAAMPAPVPPPRRRRRRERRPLPPKPGSGVQATDEESDHEHDPEPLYSKLIPAILVDGPRPEDSDEEFAAIELILQKHSLQDIRPREEVDNARPKNHSTTSLPNVADLLDKLSRTLPEDAARRPPRHVKTGSLPRDAPLFVPQTPERTIFARRIEEDGSEDGSEDTPTEDNSIRKLEAECAFGLEVGLKTSTPVKAREQPSPREPVDDSESFKDESSESRVPSSPSAAPESPSSSGVQESSRRDEDAGYESRTDSHPFSDLVHGGDEFSSGILRDAVVESFAESRNGHALVVPGVQRTISEESLPREMLVDELDEEDDHQEHQEHHHQSDDETSSKDVTDEIITNGIHDIETPPLTPVLKSRKSPRDGIEGQGSRVESSARETSTAMASGNPMSMTPSLIDLEVALTAMLEKKDEQERERERERAEDKSSDKFPEPQIVPLNRDLEDVEDHPRVSPHSRTREDEGHQPSESRLIDFPRADRMNPFNDLKSDDLEPPEKPSRLHRSNLTDESVIDEPVIVPTPPRRRHKTKSNPNSSTESTEAYHTYALGDRLI